MTFNFRFASILKLRRHQEKIKKQKLAVSLKKKANLEAEYITLNKRSREENNSDKKQSVRMNRQYYARKHDLHKNLLQLKKGITRLDIEIDRQRKQLARANTRTRMMEKLKKNEKRAFIKHVEHLEQLQQNEIAIQCYNAE